MDQTLAHPNILYIHSHDTGRYVQPYGHTVTTPHIQHLAEQGILFRKAFSAAPICSPSRSALVTGQCPHSNGMVGLANPGCGFELKDYRHHIIHTLRQAGYYSALIGRQHIAEDSKVIGYDHVQIGRNGSKCLAKVAAPLAADFLSDPPTQPSQAGVMFRDRNEAELETVHALQDLPSLRGGRHRWGCCDLNMRRQSRIPTHTNALMPARKGKRYM